MKYVVGKEGTTDLGVTEYLFGLVMFVDTFNDMKYVFKEVIENHLGE